MQKSKDCFKGIFNRKPNHPESNPNLGLLTIKSRSADGELAFLKLVVEIDSKK